MADFYELFNKPEPKLPAGAAIIPADVGRSSAYGQRALERNLSKLALATEGERNGTLNDAAFSLGQLVPHELDEHVVREQLTAVALRIGLTPTETAKTIGSGIEAGKAKPWRAPERPNGYGSRSDMEKLAGTNAHPQGPGAPISPTGSTWADVDLAETVKGLQDGTLTRPAPTIGVFAEGRALLYPGRVNGIHGDSNSGKTWTAVTLCREQLEAGEHALYIDAEDNEVGITARLLDLGVPGDVILERFHYKRPAERLDGVARDLLLTDVRTHRPALVVMDSTGELLSLDGFNPNADDEVARWMRRAARSVADLGPAVLLLDHVPKNRDGSTPLEPIGSQRKRAAATGAQYAQETVVPFAKDKPGRARLVCGKDRGGNYFRGKHVADLRIDPNSDGLTHLAEPESAEPVNGVEGAPSLTPAGRKLYEAAQALDRPATVPELVDKVAEVHGHGLKRETCSRELNKLADLGLMDGEDQGQFKPKLWWLTPSRDPRDVTRDDHTDPSSRDPRDPPLRDHASRGHAVTPREVDEVTSRDEEAST